MLKKLINKFRGKNYWPLIILAVFLWSNRFVIGYAGEAFSGMKMLISMLAGEEQDINTDDLMGGMVYAQRIYYDESYLDGAEQIAISYTDQSTYKVTRKGEYPAANCVDGDVDTCWQDGEEGYAEGAILKFAFPETKRVRYIRIRNGRAISEQKYYENGRAQNISILINGESYPVMLEDVNAYELIELSGEVYAYEVGIQIDSVYAGSKFEDTCMSEVEFYE